MTCISINPVMDQIVAAVMPVILLIICIINTILVFGIIREALEDKDVWMLMMGIITGLLDFMAIILLIGSLMS